MCFIRYIYVHYCIFIFPQVPVMDQHPHNRGHDRGHDNPVFESPSRKVSSVSEAEIGPVRKKSILHKNSDFDIVSNSGKSDTGRQNGEYRFKKHSTTDSVYSRTRFADTVHEDRSWWYIFCLQCRSDDGQQSWKPDFWPKLCPYPFCPTYRQFTRIITITLIGVLTWCIFYSVVGETAAPPNGKLFQLILLTICAHIGGWLMSLTTLPALIGMLFTGLLFQNVGFVNIDDSFSYICKELRNVALVIILIRAGLDLDPNALMRLKFSVVKLGLGPWAIEAGMTAVFSVYILGMSWSYGILLGSVIAAVSPAVVVPCLFRLRSKGYGVAKGIPTLIIAIAGVDDAASVAAFGIIKSIMFSNSSLTNLIISAPLSILGGIGFGALWGVLSNFAPERHDPFVVPLRVLLLLVGGMIAVFGSEMIGLGGAGPLGCVTAAFASICFWTKQGWDIEDNPAATAFEIFWMIFEPILFGITGTSIKLNQLDASIVYYSIGIIITVAVIRILTTILLGIGCKLNLKEKVFAAISLMAKATVQAALGPVLLSIVAADSKEHDWASKFLTTCVLSIVVTAPTGGILITILGPRLLTKTKFMPEPEGWRRSHRPSIRDISIINEEEEKEPQEVSSDSGQIKTIAVIKEVV
ncbi:sodium/hydrogen exchanger 9B2 isoform X2 [Diabrotica virgifera virgifera]|uniref:Cation/H+ exchanger transmembrane domain-containing protein n=1 Tax=Diabrotica virgifera virgifera TaxID=50390 RepID=A0ABM5K9H8_DIAVI|nr:sodium/hydrogen exchanger 9B2 isoform X2 [Diabrotica virgifera virgifera]